MKHEYGLFIKFSSPAVQNAFCNAVPPKNQLHYEEKMVFAKNIFENIYGKTNSLTY